MIFLMLLMLAAAAIHGTLAFSSANVTNYDKILKKPPTLASSPNLTAVADDQTNGNSVAAAAAADTADASSVSSIFVLGHVTKYSTILFDEIVSIDKGSHTTAIQYPEDIISNPYTIIGIFIYDNDNPDRHHNDVRILCPASDDDDGDDAATGNDDVGGIGYNFTRIKFESINLMNTINYKLEIYGVDL